MIFHMSDLCKGRRKKSSTFCGQVNPPDRQCWTEKQFFSPKTPKIWKKTEKKHLYSANVRKSPYEEGFRDFWICQKKVNDAFYYAFPNEFEICESTAQAIFCLIIILPLEEPKESRLLESAASKGLRTNKPGATQNFIVMKMLYFIAFKFQTIFNKKKLKY